MYKICTCNFTVEEKNIGKLLKICTYDPKEGPVPYVHSWNKVSLVLFQKYIYGHNKVLWNLYEKNNFFFIINQMYLDSEFSNTKVMK